MSAPSTARVSFWFEFASTYSYLSAFRIETLARAAGVTVDWRPFLLGPIFRAQGWTTSPFNIYEAKGAYMWRDIERLCAARGLRFRRPEFFPQNSLMAARVALAALDHPQGATFCRTVFSAQFGDGADISDAAVLADCLQSAGLDPTLVGAAQEPRIKSALRAGTEAAQRHGIFGAPSFLAGGELFWGDDRLEQAIAWAASSGKSAV
ncbi:MAG: 2-hydroxychromene-2-carboxylate isomerase [Pseudomonadota bacterium]